MLDPHTNAKLRDGFEFYTGQELLERRLLLGNDIRRPDDFEKIERLIPDEGDNHALRLFAGDRGAGKVNFHARLIADWRGSWLALIGIGLRGKAELGAPLLHVRVEIESAGGERRADGDIGLCGTIADCPARRAKFDLVRVGFPGGWRRPGEWRASAVGGLR
jgi:hypothetical protein